MRGFTLIELLVVMTISAILVAAAVPSYTWLIATTRVSNATNELMGTFQFARSEAIRQNLPVVVCRSLDLLQCNSAAGGGYLADDWGAGWIVFAKQGGTNTNVWEAGDPILKVEQPVSTGSRTVLLSNLTGGEKIFYSGNGMGTITATGGLTAIFSVDYRSDPTNSSIETSLTGAARCVSVSVGVGRPSARRAAAANC